MGGEASRRNGVKGGRPKGTTGILHKATLDKALQREVLRKYVFDALEPMLKAQVRHAVGVDHFFLRNPKTKQFERITDAKVIEVALNSGDRDSYYWIQSKDPSTQAFAYLLDQALDKAPQSVAISGPDGGPIEISNRLHAARARSRQV